MRRNRIKRWVWTGWLASLPWCGALAQAPAGNARPAPPPPLPTSAKSPIDYFRELLTAGPEDREKLLTGKTPPHRKVLEKSLGDYLALTPSERELRLRTLELRYHLTTLLRLAPTNRVERLKIIPERDRPLVEDRLRIWDQLSPEDQREALDNERRIRVLEAVGSGVAQRQVPLTGATSNQSRQIEQQLIQWQSLPEARRVQAQRNFTTLFELTDAEKSADSPAADLSPAERDLMQKTLDRFERLSPLQRIQCVQAFEKLAALSPSERRSFLINAQEWQKMKPKDRDSWRRLISKVPPMPPLPPGLMGQPPAPRLSPKRALAQETNLNQ
jgi:hypothetical protein